MRVAACCEVWAARLQAVKKTIYTPPPTVMSAAVARRACGEEVLQGHTMPCMQALTRCEAFVRQGSLGGHAW